MSISPTSTPSRISKDTRPRGSDADGRNIPFQVACARCKKGKKKCNNMLPCQKCHDTGAECVYTSFEKKRPVSREIVKALELVLEARNAQIEELKGRIGAVEGIVSWWERFVSDLAQGDADYREAMLAGFRSGETQEPSTAVPAAATAPAKIATTMSPDTETTRHTSPKPVQTNDGHIQPRGAGLAIFLGSTASQIANGANYPKPSNSGPNFNYNDSDYHVHALLAPQSEDCKRLMSLFFLRIYPYHMHFYREFFLRDLHAGGGPYYSDLLMYAICSVAALVSKDPAERQRSELFARRAQGLLYDSGMDSPDITVLQALLLLSQREIGQGNGSKGWLFAGMAFRLALEMGLHLDPDGLKIGSTNCESSETADIEREIRRRCYWGAFVIDKWTSLYFGRPPALSPRESDVRETKRIQYPECWQAWAHSTLDPSMISDDLFSGGRTPQDEDGAALIGTLLCGIDLTKIVHKMLTNVFEIRNQKNDPASMAATVTEIHLELTLWLNNLPKKIHWNEWSGEVEPYVLVLHMMYHAVLIVLHRPPLSLSIPAAAPEFLICWASVTAIIKLIRHYSRGNEYAYLPVMFIHTATTAASVVLMKRHTVNEQDDDEAAKYLTVILEALEGCSATWGAAAQAKEAIIRADYEARRNREEFCQPNVDKTVNDISYDMGQYFDLDNDSVMGGMGMCGGGVAGFLDLEYLEGWDTEGCWKG